MRNAIQLSFFCFLAGVLTMASALANGLSKADREALRRTQTLLQNPNALKGNGNANEKAALAEIDRIAGGDPKSAGAIHHLSSDIFADLVNQANGDPAKIQMLLLEAQKDPSKFMNSLSGARKAELRRIASEIEKKNGKK